MQVNSNLLPSKSVISLVECSTQNHLQHPSPLLLSHMAIVSIASYFSPIPEFYFVRTSFGNRLTHSENKFEESSFLYGPFKRRPLSISRFSPQFAYALVEDSLRIKGKVLFRKSEKNIHCFSVSLDFGIYQLAILAKGNSFVSS